MFFALNSCKLFISLMLWILGYQNPFAVNIYCFIVTWHPFLFMWYQTFLWLEKFPLLNWREVGLRGVNPGVSPVVLATEMATLPRILHQKPLSELILKLAERDSLLLEIMALEEHVSLGTTAKRPWLKHRKEKLNELQRGKKRRETERERGGGQGAGETGNKQPTMLFEPGSHRA